MPNEKRAFEELISEDQFDDSVCGDHQFHLRSKALAAFDQSKRNAASVQPLAQVEKPHRLNWNLVLGYSAIIAACLIGIVALSFSREKPSPDDLIVNNQQIPSVTIDPQLVASLAALDSYRDEVSPEAYFGAIAMCQTDHDGRMLFSSSRP